jgi:enoyl-CoA hydratase
MNLERTGDVAVLRMQLGKVNAIGVEFMERMPRLLDELGDARAAVLTGEGKAFSAGLDLPALIALDRTAMRKFIGLFDELMLRLFELPMPLVAAINGHAIAGGCVLALQADVRIAADKESLIGLSEAQLGIGLPASVLETLRAQVPSPSLLPIALEGRLLHPREALQLGLVHEVVAENELLPRALQRAQTLAALPRSGVRHVKASMRRPTAQAARERSAAEAERWLDGWFSPETQAYLREAIASLKKK